MPLYRDEAVVLRTHKLGEADRIITLLTRQHGRVRAVAKGVRRTTSRCPRCYAVTVTPSYLCTNTGCLVMHRDLTPGPLGIFRRRCACGTTIPSTVRQGGKHLVAVCQSCRRELPKGSGTRQIMFLPVIGAVASGKTQYLSGALISIADRVSAAGGELTTDADY